MSPFGEPVPIFIGRVGGGLANLSSKRRYINEPIFGHINFS